MQKASNLVQSAYKEFGNGPITNLMTVDVYNIAWTVESNISIFVREKF